MPAFYIFNEINVNFIIQLFENLSLIPGSVGAAPVQNIGAYGVEISSLIKSVECFDLSNNSFITINGSDCNFKYRHSCFKDNPDLLILKVNFFNNLENKFNLNYESIRSYISKNNKGMGLGIFIAKNLIENVKGKLYFYNSAQGKAVVEMQFHETILIK